VVAREQARAERTAALTPELVRKVRRIEIRTRRLVNDLFTGQYHAVFRGRGVEFSEVREYVPGDDVRAIDWNVTARLSAPFVKQFIEERELTVFLIVDVSGSGAFGTVAQTKREIAAEITALLALAAITNQDRVGLLAFSDRVEKYIAPAKGRQHVMRLIRDLLSLEPRGSGTDVAAALDYATKLFRRRAIVFVLSDFQDGGEYARSMRVLASRHDVVALTILDPRELELVDAGVVELEDPETGESMLVDSGDARVRTYYREHVQAQQAARRRLFHANGIDAIEIGTEASYVEPLVAFFRRRGRTAHPRWSGQAG
jgi:uncharacterized protein (DUF58 family)